MKPGGEIISAVLHTAVVVKMHCGVLFYLVLCSVSALTLLVGSFDP